MCLGWYLIVHELGDCPVQTDIESSFNQCYQRTSQARSLWEACGDSSLSVSTTHSSYRKPAPVSGHCEAICCSVRQEAGIQEKWQAPHSHTSTSSALLLLKVLWIFPKRRLDKYKKMCYKPFHVWQFGQIIGVRWHTNLFMKDMCITDGQRFSVFESRGSLAVELWFYPTNIFFLKLKSRFWKLGRNPQINTA